MAAQPLETKAERYDALSIFFHWLIAFGLIATFILGVYMQDLPLSPNKLKLYSWHKWAGITLFLLVGARLAWRCVRPTVTLPATMSPSMQKAAHYTHILLYALMLIIPITGWLSSSAQGVSVVWFGVLELPNLVSKSEALAAVLKAVHLTLNYSLLTLVVIHVLAALKHHFFDKDLVLYRMLPIIKRKQ